METRFFFTPPHTRHPAEWFCHIFADSAFAKLIFPNKKKLPSAEWNFSVSVCVGGVKKSLLGKEEIKSSECDNICGKTIRRCSPTTPNIVQSFYGTRVVQSWRSYNIRSWQYMYTFFTNVPRFNKSKNSYQSFSWFFSCYKINPFETYCK